MQGVRGGRDSKVPIIIVMSSYGFSRLNIHQRLITRIMPPVSERHLPLLASSNEGAPGLEASVGSPYQMDETQRVLSLRGHPEWRLAPDGAAPRGADTEHSAECALWRGIW